MRMQLLFEVTTDKYKIEQWKKSQWTPIHLSFYNKCIDDIFIVIDIT